MQQKTENKEAWRLKCAAPRLGYKQNQKATYYFSYLGHQNFNVVQKLSLLFLLGFSVFLVLYLLGKEVGREEGGY